MVPAAPSLSTCLNRLSMASGPGMQCKPQHGIPPAQSSLHGMNVLSHSQQICELQVILLNANRVILVTPSGRQVVVEAPQGCPRERTLHEFQVKFTVKDLGIHARILMGLAGYTPIWQTMRIVHQGNYLPMHRPVVTLSPRAEWHEVASHYCTFCYYSLQNKHGRLGPFEECWFCLDSPTWHHGYCCPHNPESSEWNGIPHRHQYNRGLRNFLRTLPF